MKRKSVSPASGNQPAIRETPQISEEDVENIRASFVKEIIESRNSKGLSQKRLENASGLKQSVIARMEAGETDPQLTTIIKALYPLGMTITVVPLYTKHNLFG